MIAVDLPKPFVVSSLGSFVHVTSGEASVDRVR